jgi:phage N-6-adenine-methyltransferase
MKIDTEFKNLIPPMTPEEKTLLEKNIQASKGCLAPLVAWDDTLIDGYHRYDICTEHSLPYEVKQLSFQSRDEAKVWIIENQFGRRNLQPYQRAELALELEKFLPKCKLGRPVKHIGNDSEIRNISQMPRSEELSKLAGMSTATLYQAKRVKEKAPEEMKEKLRTGEISINQAFKAVSVHVGQNSGENEWYTPKSYIDAATKVLGKIDLDPASSDKAQETVKATTYYTKETNGLTKPWTGRVFMNPPYSSDLIGKFTSKYVGHVKAKDITAGIVLVNNATETTWFQELAQVSKMICFPSKRIRFLNLVGTVGAPLQGQALLYAGQAGQQFAEVFGELGFIGEIK